MLLKQGKTQRCPSATTSLTNVREVKGSNKIGTRRRGSQFGAQALPATSRGLPLGRGRLAPRVSL